MRSFILLQCILILVSNVWTQAAEKPAEEQIKEHGSEIDTDEDFKWLFNKNNENNELSLEGDISDEEDGADVGSIQEDEDILGEDAESDGDDMDDIEQDEAKWEEDAKIDGDDMDGIEEDEAKLGEDAKTDDNEANVKDGNIEVVYELNSDNSGPCARICPRIFRPLCIKINGVETTVPSVCDLDNRIRCAQNINTSDGLPWTFEFLHDEPCEK